MGTIATLLTTLVTGVALVRDCSGGVQAGARTGAGDGPAEPALVVVNTLTPGSPEPTRSTDSPEPASTRAGAEAGAPPPRGAEPARLPPPRRAVEVPRPEPASASYLLRGRMAQVAGSGRVAVLVVPDDPDAERRIASALTEAGIPAVAGVLTPAAHRDGIVEQLAAGDRATLSALGFTNASGHLVIGRLSFDPVRNTMQDVMMTHATLTVEIVPMDGGHPTSLSFRARGAGFSETAALQQAEHRVVEDLVNALPSL